MLSFSVFCCLLAVALGLTASDNPAIDTCLCATATAGVNVRSSGCTTGALLGALNYGACVKSRAAKVTACGYTWFKVNYNGQDGWVAGDFMSVGSSSQCSSGSTGTTNVQGLTQQCLDCICEVEGCKQGCHWDVYSDSCGYYQLKIEYYTDCGSPGADWKTCSNDKACATTCVQNYMKRYGTYCTGGPAPTCADYAKIHNGGPKGCKQTGMVDTYWSKVNACLSRIG